MTQESVRHIIDEARQALVGKLPNPQDQIDAITYTLMYKFMSDIDDQSASLGGKRTFFSGDYEKYDWHELMRAEGQDQLILFREAIEKMSKNPNLPALFREIFNGAMLKFNDPRTLRLFLKEMDKFEHGHNDDLGDAYEYLLSIMSSQGGLGQFRTPRHIIEFIVKVVDPDKNDKIIDPACGTAGFLIEAYKHILKKHDGIDEDGKPNGEKRLTPTELDNIHKHFRGFDIDPTMIRTARVNMYLHGFKTPDIIEHDTLTSEDYWQDWYDVILANPPFMTPKGGIQPHKKFGVSANRAEVLFVDYIASHLKPNGRAGIIVPEGIIFQSGTAYKALRKNLVENQGLVAVISLPSGVFQPYAGVKTSILILDRKLGATKKDILFVKVSNDGFSLNTNRKPITQNDLPKALEAIKQFQKTDIPSEEDAEDFAQLVPKEKIAEDEDYNLTGDRYLANETAITKYESISLGELEKEGKITFLRGQGIAKKDIVENGKYKTIHYGELYTLYSPVIKEVISTTNFDGKIRSEVGDVLVPSTTTADAMGIAVARSVHEGGIALGGDINIIRTQNRFINADYLSWSINGPLKKQLATYAKGVNILHLSNKDLRQLKIVLPPLAVQEKIVAEIENKQSAINHAREIIKNLERERAYFDPRPRALRENWPVVKLGDEKRFAIESGGTPDSKNPIFWNGTINWATLIDLPAKEGVTELNQTERKITSEGLARSSAKLLPINTILVSSRATIGRVAIARQETATNQGFKNIIIKDSHILPEYLATYMASRLMTEKLKSLSSGGTFAEFSKTAMQSIEIPLPTLEIQRRYVTEFKKEQQIIDCSRALIDRMEAKISSVLSELWEQ